MTLRETTSSYSLMRRSISIKTITAEGEHRLLTAITHSEAGRVEDGKLVLIDVQATKIAQERAAEAAESEEAEADSDSDEKEEEGPIEVRAHLFPGKTWIGWASSNNGGKVEITGSESESTESESAEAGE